MFGKFFNNKSENKKSSTRPQLPNDSKSALPTIDLTTAEKIQVIEEALTSYQSLNFPQGVLAVCRDFKIHTEKSNRIRVELTLPFPCQGELDTLATTLSTSFAQQVDFEITLNVNTVRSSALNGGKIKNIIAIASGKGGVGKSTTAVNLAYALIAEGAKVGILDADIYGPSIPTLLGLKNAKPGSKDGKFMIPLEAHGLHAMSIGFLVDEGDATVWRGPMASGAFNQLLNETAWPELDYLLIDMPPGTGDIQLTLAQKVPVAAAVIVTTPQDIALIDAEKGIAMFDKVQVPVLGIIENMSYHLCENCGHKSHVFGEAGGEKMAKSKQTQLLGQLPLDINIRQDADFGESDIIENSTGDIASLYRRIARNITGQLFLQFDNASPLTTTVIYTD
ncbi:iron-sulfur cluster carrier protein ApbC [Colwellia sp. 4_MG-2023]|uniref:iron-sulfur cluster carrier protein ApbC n=1 Tax=unclassified Colwellia TaxID=196834 RepID=UPI0026E45727|nr:MULTISPECIES: iron-sulfur cluster carrier protein ApbC [unclassified Colwellia]MDO6508102.1 iron-sulfur cluster carrier protein ApbC [Colwellia sp. 5_MG-2023]MDO6556874.1 iron-sulfur cluster carrier protein ApbC [Colwellia sp. 4_MG-2023]